MMFFIRGPNRLSEGTRQAIARALGEHPGATEKELVDATGLARGSVAHHLRRMAAQSGVRVVRRGRAAYYFLPTVGTSYQHLMRLVRDDHCAAILRTLELKPRTGIQDLSSELSLSRKIVRRYLTELVDFGLVSRSADYRPRFELTRETTASLREVLRDDDKGLTRP
ncbi:MAG: hypothetical protein QOD77_1101 [Thermoplasmata archaeon]|jgi:DNA-binding IclR family transcriptional regulator|nr:hypothetical protein [Thermoplasmata archaeon]